MAATQVSGIMTITPLANGDNLNTTLNSTVPLYQTFKKGTTDFTPNWATMPDGDRPIVYPRVYSTLKGQVITPTDVTFKYNNVDMQFDETGLSTMPEICAGKLRLIDYAGSKALKVVGNLASDTNNDSDVISFTGAVSTGGQRLNVSAEIQILIEEATSNLYRLFMNIPDDVIDGDEESITLTAQLYNQGALVGSNVEFEFLDINGVVLQSKRQSNVLVVTRAMIDSELMIVCKAYVNNKFVMQEQRKVWDATDPHIILFSQGNDVKQSVDEDVTYTYSILNTRTGNTVSGATFSLKVYRNSDGQEVTSDFTKTNTSILVPGALVDYAQHGPVSVAVIGNIPN